MEKEPKGELIMFCPYCAQDFTISEEERKALLANKLPLPKKCPSCRKDEEKTP